MQAFRLYAIRAEGTGLSDYTGLEIHSGKVFRKVEESIIAKVYNIKANFSSGFPYYSRIYITFANHKHIH